LSKPLQAFYLSNKLTTIPGLIAVTLGNEEGQGKEGSALHLQEDLLYVNLSFAIVHFPPVPPPPLLDHQKIKYLNLLLLCP